MAENNALRGRVGPPGIPGAKGERGPQGEKGASGADGKTPVKGVDYFTPDEKTEIAAEAAGMVHIPVDDSLTMNGQAADAKATGDALRAVSAENAELKQDKADKTALAQTDRSLDALWKLNQGISYQFETDDAVSCQKAVPGGAKLASVEKIGGKTVVWNQLVDSSTLKSRGTVDSVGVTLLIDGNNVSVSGVSKVENNLFFSSFCNVQKGKYYLTGVRENSYHSRLYATGGSIVPIAKSIFDLTEDVMMQHQFYFIGGVNVACTFHKPNLINLTALFGAGNEPSTTDDPRIAWIEQYADAHPEYNTGELVSAEVESVKYNDAVISDIPAAIRSLPGYGWSAGAVYNSIERTDTGWQYVQRVGCVDLGALDYIRSSAPQRFEAIQVVPSISATPTDRTPNVICDLYVPVPSGSSPYPDMCIYINANGFIRIHDASRYSLTRYEFKTAMSGVMLYYELVDAIITDITDLMDGVLDAIPVESGGTLTFENAAKLDVPNAIEYAVKLSEVNGS